MNFESLKSSDQVKRIFPDESDVLHSLVKPTFNTIRKSLKEINISCIWIDSSYDPSKKGFRESYDDRYGPGSTNVMPFIGSWLSTGGHSEKDNTIILPNGIDRTVVEFMQENFNLLGKVDYIKSLDELKDKVIKSGKKLYSIDDIDNFEDNLVISNDLGHLLNSKEQLHKVSSFAPQDIIKDMDDVTVSDYKSLSKDGRKVYLKTCNTESAGAGVFICNNETDFSNHLSDIKEKQAKFNLNRTLVIQAELVGKNRNFQVFLDPNNKAEIQIIAITDQLVEDDGKTYKGSINYEINQENLKNVGPVIIDMVKKIRVLYPEVFGFLMCDFFEDGKGNITIYDPGLRPTGNTATALARLLTEYLTPGENLYVSHFPFNSGTEGLKFKDFVKKAGDLFTLENIQKNQFGLLPWGWNDILGFGVLIGIAPNEGQYHSLIEKVNQIMD